MTWTKAGLKSSLVMQNFSPKSKAFAKRTKKLFILSCINILLVNHHTNVLQMTYKRESKQMLKKKRQVLKPNKLNKNYTSYLKYLTFNSLEKNAKIVGKKEKED